MEQKPERLPSKSVLSSASTLALNFMLLVIYNIGTRKMLHVLRVKFDGLLFHSTSSSFETIKCKYRERARSQRRRTKTLQNMQIHTKVK